ncbi:gpW family head-tail joining protein [Marinicellulosiphila megalodicopiae]|uniref:gpW family head-tail joining protein n=1 Tax=Marinicellulosiphila megalodicopiae TaxID=2724896 RepID=UPI003BB1F8EF
MNISKATAQIYLAEAQKALHNLNIGRAVVSVNVDGNSTQFNAANIGQLRAYIQRLENIISGQSARLRPARFEI